MNCLTEEIRKIAFRKTMIVFFILCLLLNTGIILAGASKSGEWKELSVHYEALTGREIFRDMDGSAFGSVYYDERYRKSSTLVEWMHGKYQKLESSLQLLSEKQADLSAYAGALTPDVHRALFEYLTKALMVEGILLFSFLLLESFYMEYRNKTDGTVYSSFRGRSIVFDKMLAALIAGLLCTSVLCFTCYFFFFSLWDFEKIWDANVASSFNYIHDDDDPVFMKPFITWTSFTVRQYFCASVGLMYGIWLAWWMLSSAIVLVNKRISAAAGALAVCLFLPYFGLFLFRQIPELYFLNNWSITVDVYLNQMWFTDLGYYTLFPWQETLSVGFHLFLGTGGVFAGFILFRRKDLCS